MLGGHTCGGLRIPLDAVLRSQRRGGLEVVPVRLQQIGQFDEELLESGRGNDLHQARRPIGGNYRFEVIGSDAPATPSAGKGSRSEPVVILAPELVPITPEEEQRAHLALADMLAPLLKRRLGRRPKRTSRFESCRGVQFHLMGDRTAPGDR